MSKDYFQLKRRIDNLVYEFHRSERKDGTIGYKRIDGEYWINWHKDYGWVAWDGVSQEIAGRPWYVLPVNQGDHPPEGIWVSMKNDKSYVYDLVYPTDQ